MDCYKELEDSVRESYACVVWSHKIQEKQADIYYKKYVFMEWCSIITAGVTSLGVLSVIFTDPVWVKVLTAIISFVSFCVTAYLKNFDLRKVIVLHKSTASKLIGVRDQYKVLLLEIRLKSDSVSNILDRYKDLVGRTDSIYLDAPNTTDEAVEKAREALNVKKDNTFTEEEIDSFLPISLRSK